MPSEEARQERWRRIEAQERSRIPDLNPRERLFYPGELGAAADVIESFANRLEAGDDVIEGDVIIDKLRGLARAIRGQAAWVARLRSSALVGQEDPFRKLPG